MVRSPFYLRAALPGPPATRSSRKSATACIRSARMPGAVRADSFTIKGVNETNSGPQSFIVLTATVDAWYERGFEPKYYDAALLVDALAHPTSIFRGIKRRGMAMDGLCYCCKPATRHGGLVLPERKMVFGAY